MKNAFITNNFLPFLLSDNGESGERGVGRHCYHIEADSAALYTALGFGDKYIHTLINIQ
jgi:hypothetical protein